MSLSGPIGMRTGQGDGVTFAHFSNKELKSSVIKILGLKSEPEWHSHAIEDTCLQLESV